MKELSHEKSSRKLHSSVKLFLKTMKRYSVVDKKTRYTVVDKIKRGKARLKFGIFNVFLEIIYYFKI